MKRRSVLFAVVGVLVLMIGVFAYIVTRPSDTSIQQTTTYAKAMATPTNEKCLADNTALHISSGDLNSVQMVAMSYLIDVPAGTKVDTKFATYSAGKITGSDRYPAKYGNYNFVLQKQDGNWKITRFTHCD